MAFLTQEAFEAKVEAEKQEHLVTSWCDLERKVYQIILIEEKFSEKYGPCFLGSVIDKSGERERIWLPSLMLRNIEENKSEKKDIFFVPNGQKKLSKVKSVNLFDIVFQDGKKLISEIFRYVS